MKTIKPQTPIDTELIIEPPPPDDYPKPVPVPQGTITTRGDDYAATGFDYRCYVSQEDGKTPWMGNRGYRSPRPNWQRVR